MTALPLSRTFELFIPFLQGRRYVIATFTAEDIRAAASEAARHLRHLFGVNAAVYQFDALGVPDIRQATFSAPVQAHLTEAAS